MNPIDTSAGATARRAAGMCLLFLAPVAGLAAQDRVDVSPFAGVYVPLADVIREDGGRVRQQIGPLLGARGVYWLAPDLGVEGPSGRELAYTEIGDVGWPCVFFFHGAPMSRLHLAYLEQRFIAARVRVVSPDRPAYGGSSAQPVRSMADRPSDVAALGDALGMARRMGRLSRVRA